MVEAQRLTKEIKAEFDTRQGINEWKYWKSK